MTIGYSARFPNGFVNLAEEIEMRFGQQEGK
jgi:hypothetical protein